MGEVFEAWDRELCRAVAMKVLRAPAEAGPSTLAPVLREARAAAQLSHPAIVPVYDVGILSDGRPFIVMQKVDGRPLSAISLPIPPEVMAQWLIPVCEALHEAHESGVVHRDIKPQNLLLLSGRDEPRVRLLDFGVAKIVDSDSASSSQGRFVGTARYCSPEQAEGSEVGPSADLYSLGVLMFELVTGRPPFQGDTPASLLYQHVNRRAPDIRTVVPTAPPAIASLVARCLQKDPASRPHDAACVALELRMFLSSSTVDDQSFEDSAAAVSGSLEDPVTRGRPTVDTGPDPQNSANRLTVAQFQAHRPPLVGRGIVSTVVTVALLALGTFAYSSGHHDTAASRRSVADVSTVAPALQGAVSPVSRLPADGHQQPAAAPDLPSSVVAAKRQGAMTPASVTEDQTARVRGQKQIGEVGAVEAANAPSPDPASTDGQQSSRTRPGPSRGSLDVSPSQIQPVPASEHPANRVRSELRAMQWPPRDNDRVDVLRSELRRVAAVER